MQNPWDTAPIADEKEPMPWESAPTAAPWESAPTVEQHADSAIQDAPSAPEVAQKKIGMWDRYTNALHKGSLYGAYKWATGDTERDALDDSVQNSLKNYGEGSPQHQAAVQRVQEFTSQEEAPAEDIDWGAALNAVKEDPLGVAKEVAVQMAAEPQYFLLPVGWAKAAATTTKVVGALGASANVAKGAGVVGGIGGAAALGGATEAEISLLKQMGKGNFEGVDLDKVSDAAIIGAGIGAATGALLAGGSAIIKSMANRAGADAVKAAEEFKKALADGVKHPEALTELGKRMGLSPAEIADEIKKLDMMSVETVKKASLAVPSQRKTARTEKLRKLEAEEKLARKKKEEDVAWMARETEKEIEIGRQLDEMAIMNEADRAGSTAIAKAFGDAIVNKQSGKIDPFLLGVVGASSLGGMVAFSHDQDPLDAAVAVAIIAGSAATGARAWGRMASRAAKGAEKIAKQPIRVNKLMDNWSGNLAAADRQSSQVMWGMKELLPDINDRVAITHAIEAKNYSALTPDQKTVVAMFKAQTNRLWELAKAEGVLDSFLEDYVPHFWRKPLGSKSEIINELAIKHSGGMSGHTMHAEQRLLPSYKDGIALGLEPQTLDSADLLKMYQDGIMRAIENKKLVAAVKSATDPDGNALIMGVKEAPNGFKAVDHPALRGSLVHPEIWDSLSFAFPKTIDNRIAKAAEALNYGMKRATVGFSLFHAKALLESAIYSGTITFADVAKFGAKSMIYPAQHPIKTIKGAGEVAKAVVHPKKQLNKGFNALMRKADETHALNMLRQGGVGDEIDLALRSGLGITLEDMTSDVFYAGLKDLQNGTEHLMTKLGGERFGKLGKGMGADVIKINEALDQIMWEKIMTGFKLQTFLKQMEVQTKKMTKKHLRNPEKYPMPSTEETAKAVAAYTNDAFGGQDWRRLAENVKTPMFRKWALAANHPNARKASQIAMFAPDWTISNLRIGFKAFFKVADNMQKQLRGKKVTLTDKMVARMYVSYLIRASVFTLTTANAINYMITGRNMWDNAEGERTTIDLGDGRRQVASKQLFEPIEWMVEPGKTALGKAGILPKLGIELMTNKQWASTGYAPDITHPNAPIPKKVSDYIGHVGSKVVPITVGVAANKGVADAAWGFIGHPRYGMTKKQKEEMARERKRLNKKYGKPKH